MDYFRNDVEAITVSGLSIENGIGRVSLHGSAEFAADEASLERLRSLSTRLSEMEKALMDAIQQGLLPENNRLVLETIENPFS